MSTKTKNIIAWILSGLLALIFVMSGVTKLMGVEMQIRNLESWGYPLWFRFPIGITDLLLGIGLLLLPFRKLTVYGIFAWTVAAVFTHVQAGQLSMIGVPIAFAAIAGLILLLSHDQPFSITKPLTR